MPEVREAGKDYEKVMTYVKGQFLNKNKSPDERQVRAASPRLATAANPSPPPPPMAP